MVYLPVSHPLDNLAAVDLTNWGKKAKIKTRLTGNGKGMIMVCHRKLKAVTME